MTVSVRRLTVGAFVIVAAMLAMLLVGSPVRAESKVGELHVKGVGSVYSNGNGASVAEVLTPGTARSFELKVVNTGTSLNQYRVTIEQDPGDEPDPGDPVPVMPEAKLDLMEGSTNVSSLATRVGYYTKALKPGASQQFSLKVLAPVGSVQTTPPIRFQVRLYSLEGEHLQVVHVSGPIKAPAHGSGPVSLFIKQGTQPYVGGSPLGAFISSAALKADQSATFTLKLQNDSDVSRALSLRSSNDGSACLTRTVKVGSTDVSSAVFNDEWSTRLMAPGAYTILTLKVTRDKDGPGCDSISTESIAFWARSGGSAGGSEVGSSAHIPMPLNWQGL